MTNIWMNRKKLDECAYIQDIEYNEQIIKIGRELNKRDI